MNIKQCIYLSAVIACSLSSCSGDNGVENDTEPITYNVSGRVEKGPFVSGSAITLQPMDDNLQALGSLYSAAIQDNLGNFSFGSKLFEAPYAQLTANGYFFNEVKGDLSSGTLNLRALADLSDQTTVNVNLLTHLKYQRIQKLVAEGMKFGEANKQAQKELFAAFGLQKYAEKDASTFSIAGGTDESAALIALSSLLLVDRSEAALTEYLAKLCREFGEKGRFESSTLEQIREDKGLLSNRLSSVRENVVERYGELGLKIEVKELRYFIDWDDDGVAGNETLRDGQEVKLETSELNVPNEGGVYTIRITSPIPVYLTPMTDRDDDGPIVSIPEEDIFLGIYENIENDDISMQESIEGNTLTIKVSRLNSRTAKSAIVPIYDCLGNALAEVKVAQQGNGNTSMPKLGAPAAQVVADFALSIARGLSEFNLIEQYYHHNKEADLVSQYVSPGSSNVKNIWSDFYSANREIMLFKEKDAEQLGVYQDYLNVFSAMHYYYMAVAWGDVPYINFVPTIDNIYIGRTPMRDIFSDLKANLGKAIDHLEEKKNESLGADMNELFFLSKDVARILLADIYMYQGEYDQAEKILEKVISNGFYELDASNYSDKAAIVDLLNNGGGKETLFAACRDRQTRTRENLLIAAPAVVPIMTYTDVVLSYAECLCKNGKVPEAESQLEKVTTAKNVVATGSNTIEKIKDARLQLMLYTNTNFAFMKRNNFAKDAYGIEEYRQLLPIPESEIMCNPSMTQNSGY